MGLGQTLQLHTEDRPVVCRCSELGRRQVIREVGTPDREKQRRQKQEAG